MLFAARSRDSKVNLLAGLFRCPLDVWMCIDHAILSARISGRVKFCGFLVVVFLVPR